MKKFLLVFGITISCNLFNSNPNLKDVDFENSILLQKLDTICMLVANKDTTELNRFIKPGQGLIVYYRRGAFEQFKVYKEFPDEFIYPEYYPFQDSNKFSCSFSYDEIPSYDCGNNQWSKKGSFAILEPNRNYLSKSLELTESSQGKGISEEIKEQIENIERKGIMAINTEIGSDGITFWVLESNGKYYLTLIDLVQTDCSF